ncbi:MAG: GSCFA domain-containing protein [Brumimicrobium sp.]|nr:GSCFA domain-containing protein [Brumimicrobium sp.]
MKKTVVQIKPDPFISYDKNYCFIGSCFSENLSGKMIRNGFQVGINPLGVLFNPLSIGEALTNSNKDSRKQLVTSRSELFFSWEASGTLFGHSEKEMMTKIDGNISRFRDQLTTAEALFVTFGSAYVYRLKENNKVVANCHKFPSDIFIKELLQVDEIVDHWQGVISELKGLNRNLRIIFTLSPVRHIKDGLIENARSKAILLESIHRITEKKDNCNYFPAFEIVMDELRDYGYFGKDGIHPNDIAVDFIWERFKDSFVTPKATEVIETVEKLRKDFEHRFINAEGKEARDFKENRELRLQQMKKKYPEVNWEIFIRE